MNLAKQIQADIKSNLTRDKLQEAEKDVLKKMDEIKDRQTSAGKSPAHNGRWNNRYNRQYANREKGGRRSPVTMRRNKSSTSIERTRIIGKKDKSTLKFEDRRKGVIFNLHHSGRAKGKKFRQIYPNKDSEVPKALDETAENAVFRLLNR